ncbi:hypothetical protein ACLMJK_002868 [Lecanora helva]
MFVATHALTLDLSTLLNSTSSAANASDDNLTFTPNWHCTRDASWTARESPHIYYYQDSCQQAMSEAMLELKSHGMDTDFEFLTTGTAPTTNLPKMYLPRRYASKPGTQLPDQPTGPLSSTDTATPRELTFYPQTFTPFVHCMRHGPDLRDTDTYHMGWERAGTNGNIGIFMLGTRSPMDRRFPRGIYPRLGGGDGGVEVE